MTRGRFAYRVENRPVGDRKWEVHGGEQPTLESARRHLSLLKREDAEDGDHWEYRIARRPEQWEVVE